MEECVAFGDNFNDLDMLSVGLGVAMGNAPDELNRLPIESLLRIMMMGLH